MEKGPLHWSERAKMYPASFKVSGTPSPQPDDSRRDEQPSGGAPKKSSSRKGFLIVLLVLLICAAAAAVVFLWYLPSQDSDGVDPELEARSLVREAVLAIDEVYADIGTYEPQTMDPASLNAIAPDITFLPASDTSAATSPRALAEKGEVGYAGTKTSYAVGALSANGTAYGVLVDNADVYEVTYYLNGQAVESWEQSAPVETTPTSDDQNTDTENGDTAEDASQTTTASKTDPTYDAEDIEALILLRDTMATMEAAYADIGTFVPSSLTPALLQEMDPSVSFVIRDSDQAAKAPVSTAEDMSLDLYGTATSYALGLKSESGADFGVIVEKSGSGQGTTYYVNGEVDDWSDELPAPVIGHLLQEATG